MSDLNEWWTIEYDDGDGVFYATGGRINTFDLAVRIAEGKRGDKRRTRNVKIIHHTVQSNVEFEKTWRRGE